MPALVEPYQKNYILLENMLLILCSVKAGRVILRKGHVPQNYYLIYSGSVFINVEVITASGHHTASTELVLGKGNAFGVSALMLSCKLRTFKTINQSSACVCASHRCLVYNCL